MNKLPRNTWPNQHGPNDFVGFGPVAKTDGEFSNCCVAHLGCFSQGEIDSNKYIEFNVVQSKINSKWSMYKEWGRTGQKPDFQFVECNNKQEAQCLLEKEALAKNIKRGEFVNIGGIRTLRPKKGKSLYLVRDLVNRDTGLPDARNISCATAKIVSKSSKSSKSSKVIFDREADKLLSDLSIGTVDYTKSNMIGGIIPSLNSIETARKLLDEAISITNNDNNFLENIELKELSEYIYSIIPKIKPLKVSKSQWILTPENIADWRCNLDTYESALKTYDTTETTVVYNFELEYLQLDSTLGKQLLTLFDKSKTKNSYHNNNVKVVGIWKVVKDKTRFSNKQVEISKQDTSNREVPENQYLRTDIDNHDQYHKSKTYFLWHGSRTVNIKSLLENGFLLPKQLSGVSFSGAYLGSGIYTASSPSKSLGYSSLSRSGWSKGSGGIQGRGGFLFLTDIILGKIHLALGGKGYISAPSGFHSVMGKKNYTGYLQHDEFVVYNTDQTLLRYLIEVKEI